MTDDQFVDYASSLEPRSLVLRQLKDQENWKVGLHLLTTGRSRSEIRPPLEMPIAFHRITAGWLLPPLKAWPALYNRILPQIMSWQFLNEVLTEAPDLLVFRGNMFSLCSHWLARQLLRRGIPYIYENHGAGIVVNNRLNPFVSGAAAVIVLTPEAKRELVNGYRLPASKVKVISNGVATSHFKPRRKPDPTAYPTLAFVGRLSPEKGFDLALASFMALSKTWPNAKLEIAGKPLPETDAWAQSLIAAVPPEQRGRVKLHGWLSADALIDLYNRCDLLLFPSRAKYSSHGEGEPRAVLEAMACGTPVVAVAESGGHCNIIVNSRTGALATHERHFSHSVEKLIEEQEKMGSDRLVARDFILHNYSIDAVYALYRTCCIEALKAKHDVSN